VLLYLFMFSFCLSLAVRPVPIAAQAAQITLHQIDDSRFPLVDAIVSVTEGTRPLRGLSGDAFSLVEDGLIVPVREVTTLERSDSGVSLILALDVSRSMVANNGLGGAREAALAILDRLGPNDRVALLAFSDQIDLGLETLNPAREISFTDDKDAVRSAIQALEAGGGTPLFDAAIKGIRMSRVEPRGSRAMILLTDGRDERIEEEGRVPGSVFRDTDAINEAREADMPIFTIGLGTEIDRNFLIRLADQSGGNFQEAPSGDQLQAFFNNALDQLLQRYVISYESQVAPDTGTHSLLIQLETPTDRASVADTFASQAPEVPGVRLDLQDGEEVQGSLRLRPTIFAQDEVSRVELVVDGEAISQDGTAPYVLTWRSDEPRWLESLQHSVTIRATDVDGEVGERTVNIIVQPPPTPEPASPNAVPTASPTVAPTELAVVVEEPDTETGEEANTAVTDPPPDEGGDDSAVAARVGPNWPLMFVLLGLVVLALVTPLVLQGRRRAPVMERTIRDSNIPAPPPLPAPIMPIPSPTIDAAPEPRRGEGVLPVEETVLLRREPPLLAYLVEVGGPRAGQTHRILSDRTEVGRGPQAQVRLSDPAISRRQAIIRREEGEFFVYDLASSNPSHVNGTVVTGRAPLRDRDVLRFGEMRLQFIQVEQRSDE
jgi:Mg-chelatase subunit ChlD/pSer/pThr/pTyr-binding forkhead associated (FHA) protein